jgi:acyl-CoA reductase-like NAD-dependent aldehyde dehydrogenase
MERGYRIPDMITTEIPASSVTESVERCRRQQQAWSQLPISGRLQVARSLRHLLVTECDALCTAVEQDINKPIEETLAGEVIPLAAACKFLEKNARRILRSRKVSVFSRPLWLWGQSDVVHRRPRGIVGIIGTWNYPLILNGVQLLQALVAGNGVLWKPSELGRSSARVLFGLLERAGCPAGLVELLPATREAGRELANADIDHVVFTGASTTGRVLAENLGRRLISSTMELSGCDAMFVLDDADIALASQAAWFGATLNRGQTCLATRRVFVQRKCYDAFLDALGQYVARSQPMRLALASQVQQAEQLARDAVSEGARLLRPLPGDAADADGRSYLPTAIVDARPEMAICLEAVFAPVLAVLPFDAEADVEKLDDCCPYGLGASVFSGDPRRAARVAARLHAGNVMTNDVIVATAHPATPLGGFGESGWGVTQGAEGLLEMTVPQTISTRSGNSRPHYGVACGTPVFTEQILRGLLQWSHGATFSQRLGGLRRLLRGWWKKT